MRLVVFGHNDWWTWRAQGFCGRNAALVRALARRAEVESVAVVDTPRYRSRTRRPREHRRETVTAVAPKIVAVRHEFDLPLPAGWHAGRLVNETLARPRLLRRVAAAAPGADKPVVWVADPRQARTAGAVGGELLVFDAIDDWRYLPAAGRRSVEAGYRWLASHADLTLAVSPVLLERLQPRGKHEVLLNAVEWSEWEHQEPNARVFAGLSRPIVVYAGTLQQRVDVELAAAVATLLPEASFVLMGPVHRGFGLPPGSPPNLLLRPPMPHGEMPGVLAAADLCMVPHRGDGIVPSMDPLKVYEYLAAGRPVVSTTRPLLPALVPLVTVADTADSFAAGVRAEVALDDEGRRAARREAVRSETWDARADRVLALVREVRAARRAAQPREAAR